MTRLDLALGCSIRFHLTEDEETFVRMGLVQALKAERLPTTTADVDATYEEALRRLTFAGYRQLRDAKAAWEAETLARFTAHLAATSPSWSDPASDPMEDLRRATVDAAERAGPLAG